MSHLKAGPSPVHGSHIGQLKAEETKLELLNLQLESSDLVKQTSLHHETSQLDIQQQNEADNTLPKLNLIGTDHFKRERSMLNVPMHTMSRQNTKLSHKLPDIFTRRKTICYTDSWEVLKVQLD